MMEDPYYGSPHSYVKRDNREESIDLLAHEELVELVERSLDEPPAKRIFMWC